MSNRPILKQQNIKAPHKKRYFFAIKLDVTWLIESSKIKLAT